MPGNVFSSDPSIDNRTAEWNFYVDPKAADIVFKSEIALTLLTLDASNDVRIDKDFYTRIEQIQP